MNRKRKKRRIRRVAHFFNSCLSPMALVLPPHSMTTSILLRSPSHLSPFPSPSPSSVSTPLPALQTDLSSSSSSSASGSCLDLHRSASTPSTRRIRFAPLPEPRRDLLFEPHDPSDDDPQVETKPATQTLPPPNDLPDGFVALSPSVSPVSTLSSARSTPTIRISPYAASNTQKFFRPFSFLRPSRSSSPCQSPPSQSAPLPSSRNPAPSSSSLPNSPSFQSVKLSRFSAEDILTLGTKSLFRARSGSASSTRPPRSSSPPPKSSDPSRFLHRSSTTSGPGITLGTGKRDGGEGSSQSHDTAAIAGSGPKKRRASSSALTPGAGGGRHACSVKMHPNNTTPRPSTAPSSPIAAPKKHVKMLNGRIYGAKRYAGEYMRLAQSCTSPTYQLQLKLLQIPLPMSAMSPNSSNGATAEWVVSMPLQVLRMTCGKGYRGVSAVVRCLQVLRLVHLPNQLIQLLERLLLVVGGAVEHARLRRLPVGKCQTIFLNVAWAMFPLVVG